MKKTLAIFLVLVFCITGSAMAGLVSHRQIHQQERIGQGIHSGELTGGEVRALEREQRHIQYSKESALSDGVVTPGERARLHSQQDRASQHIYRLKHNARKQP